MFLAGVVTLYTVAVRPTEVVVTETGATTVSLDTELPPAPIEGVSPVVAEVLGAAGVAGVLTPEEATQLAPEVARVLAHYGVTLVVPDRSGSEG